MHEMLLDLMMVSVQKLQTQPTNLGLCFNRLTYKMSRKVEVCVCVFETHLGHDRLNAHMLRASRSAV